MPSLYPRPACRELSASERPHSIKASARPPLGPSPSPVQKATPLAASASDDISAISQSSSSSDVGLDTDAAPSLAARLLAHVTSTGSELPSSSTFALPTPLLPPAVTTPPSERPASRVSARSTGSNPDDDLCPCNDCQVLRSNGSPPNPHHRPVWEDELTMTDAEALIEVYHDTYNPHPTRVAKKMVQKWAHRRDNLIVHFFLLGKARSVAQHDLYRRALSRAEQDIRYPRYVAGLSNRIDSPPRRRGRSTI